MRAELAGRYVLAFLSQVRAELGMMGEVFFVDGQLEGFCAVELTEPG